VAAIVPDCGSIEPLEVARQIPPRPDRLAVAVVAMAAVPDRRWHG